MLDKFLSKFIYVLYLIGFLLIVFLAIKFRIGIPFVPTEIYDEYYYLLISTSKGLPPDSGMTNPYYQLLVYGFSHLFKSLSGIVFFQVFLVLIEVFFVFLIFKEIKKTYLKDRFSLKNILFYLVSLIFLFVFLFSSSKIRFEYQMRLESISGFLEIIFVYLFLKLFNNKTDKNRLSMIIVYVSVFACLFQNKFFFLGLFNVFLVIILNVKTKKVRKKFQAVKVILVPILLMLVFNKLVTSKIQKNDFNRILYDSMLFWRNFKTIDKYIVKDINDPNFTKFNKELLRDFRSVYLPKRYLYNLNSNIPLGELDIIIYKDAVGIYKKHNQNKEINYLFKYYLAKSMFFSPREYLADYWRELKKIFSNKNIHVIKPSFFYFEKKEYIDLKKWMIANHEKENNYYFNSYLKDLDKVINNYSNIKSIPVLTKLEYFLSSKYLVLVLLSILCIVVRCFFKMKSLLSIESMVIYLILAPIIMYSVTAFTYLFDERYLAEILPLFLMSYYFIVLFFIFLISDVIKFLINICHRK